MLAVLRQELRQAVRNRWLLGYTLLLGLLGLAAAWAGLRGSEGMALQMFGRTAATLTNLCLFLAPLVALTLGASTIAGERDRGTLDFLLAQPLERWELIVGKYLGLLAALTVATLLGFAPAGLVVLAQAGSTPALHFLIFPLLAILLVTAMLALGLVLSVAGSSGVVAQGLGVFLWFSCVLLYDLLLMAVLMGTGLGPGLLAVLLLLNPVDAARVLVVLALEPDLYLLGPAGAWLLSALSPTGTAAVLVGSLLAWTLGALGAAIWLFRAPPAGERTAVFRRAVRRRRARSELRLPPPAGAAKTRLSEPQEPPERASEPASGRGLARSVAPITEHLAVTGTSIYRK